MRTDKYVIEDLRSFEAPTQSQVREKIKESFARRGLECPKEGNFIARSAEVTVGETKGQIKFLIARCNFGGFRYWYECPICHKRAYKLYRNGGFRCRKCFPSIYKKQCESKKYRSFDVIFGVKEEELKKHRLVYKGRLTKYGKRLEALGDITAKASYRYCVDNNIPLGVDDLTLRESILYK